MEWNLKAPSTSWDLAEVDQTTLTNMDTVVDGSSRYGEFSVDLKLGHVGNSGSKDVGVFGGGVSKMTTSSGSGSGSTKRARGINNGIQTVLCLVDGCQADLSNCRDYHRRHKVCELHSKTAQVTIGGHKQRFCQQCSRFHSLEEFDEGKRSCRKRLDGHNRRRRKPQAEPITRSGSFLSNYQGTQLLPFSSSHMYPSTAMVVSPSWGGGSAVTSSYPDIRLHNQHQQMHHHNHLVDKQDLYLGSSPTNNNNYKEMKNMSFIQQGDHSATLSNNQNPHLTSSESTFRRNNNPFSVNDSTCALSLLSSTHQTHHHDHANGLNQQMMNNHHSSSSSTSFMQPLGLSLYDHHSSLGSVDPVLGSSGSDHCSSMYDMGSSESQGNEAPTLFPFQWE